MPSASRLPERVAKGRGGGSKWLHNPGLKDSQSAEESNMAP